MTMVKTTIASARSLNRTRYAKTSKLKSGRKKTSHGGVKCSIPRNPSPNGNGKVSSSSAQLLSAPGRSRPDAADGSARCAAAHPRPAQQPVALDGLVGVLGARRVIAAAGRQPRE